MEHSAAPWYLVGTLIAMYVVGLRFFASGGGLIYPAQERNKNFDAAFRIFDNPTAPQQPNLSHMRQQQPLCHRCHDNLFVRAEQVISGRRIVQAYYCGRCNHEWHIDTRHTPERREGERRNPVKATLPPKSDRRIKQVS